MAAAAAKKLADEAAARKRAEVAAAAAKKLADEAAAKKRAEVAAAAVKKLVDQAATKKRAEETASHPPPAEPQPSTGKGKAPAPVSGPPAPRSVQPADSAKESGSVKNEPPLISAPAGSDTSGGKPKGAVDWIKDKAKKAVDAHRQAGKEMVETMKADPALTDAFLPERGLLIPGVPGGVSLPVKPGPALVTAEGVVVSKGTAAVGKGGAASIPLPSGVLTMAGSGGGQKPEPEQSGSKGEASTGDSAPREPEGKLQGQYQPPPRGDLDGGIKATRVKTMSNRARWQDERGNIYEWDSQHGKLEKFNKAGKHQGEFDPISGRQTKPADPKRRAE